MKRKAIAKETLEIETNGLYEINGKIVDFKEEQRFSENESKLIDLVLGEKILKSIKPEMKSIPKYKVVNKSTVDAIIDMNKDGKSVSALNFASAKNPGGGFLNGAMAQEEALAASSGLYNTLLLHQDYYIKNRECKTMMYTNHAIYSPDVVFFRDGKFNLIEEFAKSSILTIPAVNFGQVILKGEDEKLAKVIMKERMRLCLAIFAYMNEKNIILGAYGCGVFRNDVNDIALWWKELLEEEGYGCFFDEVVFAVLNRSKNSKSIDTFEKVFGK